MGLTLITPATALPVSLAECKAICRIEADETQFGTELELYRQAAHDHVAELLGSALGESTWLLTLDAFSDAIELPRGPVTAVGAFEYLDADGNAQAVDPAAYVTDLVSEPQWIVRASDASWPTPLDTVNAVTVQFTAGYTGATLPNGLKMALLGLVKHWFENGPAAGVPETVLTALAPWRKLWICA